LHSVPLFTQEGNEYKWCHKSFQEYFAASFICIDAKNKQGDYLKKLSQEDKIEKYFNVLDFCYDLDDKQFKHEIIYDLIEEFLKYYESEYSSNKFVEYDKKQIDIRKNINFIYKEINICFCIKTSGEINKIMNGHKWNIMRQYGEKFQIAYNFNNKRTNYLLNLLGSKKCDIVEFINKSDTRFSDYLFDKDGFYEVNDNDDNIINVTNEKFEQVNDDILHSAAILNIRSHKRGQYIFNVNKCLKLKENIENEIAIDKEEIIF
jgi:hypothetical protein